MSGLLRRTPICVSKEVWRLLAASQAANTPPGTGGSAAGVCVWCSMNRLAASCIAQAVPLPSSNASASSLYTSAWPTAALTAQQVYTCQAELTHVHDTASDSAASSTAKHSRNILTYKSCLAGAGADVQATQTAAFSAGIAAGAAAAVMAVAAADAPEVNDVKADG